MKKKILKTALVLFLIWASLVTVDYLRLTNTDSYKEPLIPLSSIHYAYDYTEIDGLGYTIRYDYGGDETYEIQKTTFRLFGITIYEQ